MRKCFFVLSTVAFLALPACGGDDDGGGMGDAPDAGADPDASMGDPDGGGEMLTGLGEVCGTTQDDMCTDQSAPLCIVPAQGQPGICSLQCGEAGTVEIETNEDGEIANVTGQDDQACAAAFSGSVGTPLCATFLANDNGDLPEEPEPNSTYTADMACAIVCAQTQPQCPGDLVCGPQGACQAP